MIISKKANRNGKVLIYFTYSLKYDQANCDCQSNKPKYPEHFVHIIFLVTQT